MSSQILNTFWEDPGYDVALKFPLQAVEDLCQEKVEVLLLHLPLVVEYSHVGMVQEMIPCWKNLRLSLVPPLV